MKHRANVTITFAALLIACAIGGILASRRTFTTLESLSPDEFYRVHLVELPAFIDRNFELRLEDREMESTSVIFRSSDEGRPIGSERIIWSQDASKFLLVGRHFFVHDEVDSSDGEVLYLMYDIPSGKLWCNSEQSDYPRFGKKQTDRIKWHNAR